MQIVLTGKYIKEKWYSEFLFHKAFEKLYPGTPYIPYSALGNSKDLLSAADALVIFEGCGIVPSVLEGLKCCKIVVFPGALGIKKNAIIRLKRLATFCDFIYCLDTTRAEDVGHRLGITLYPLLPATDPEVYPPVVNANPIYDVIFWGVMKPIRKALLSELKKHCSVYHRRAFLSQVPTFCGSGRIAFNKSLTHAYNNRVFESLGMKLFLITDFVEERYRVFEHRKHLVYYKDEELIEEVLYYLQRPEARLQIAEAGYKEVLEKHTYVHRVAHLMSRIGG